MGGKKELLNEEVLYLKGILKEKSKILYLSKDYQI